MRQLPGFKLEERIVADFQVHDAMLNAMEIGVE